MMTWIVWLSSLSGNKRVGSASEPFVRGVFTLTPFTDTKDRPATFTSIRRIFYTAVSEIPGLVANGNRPEKSANGSPATRSPLTAFLDTSWGPGVSRFTLTLLSSMAVRLRPQHHRSGRSRSFRHLPRAERKSRPIRRAGQAGPSGSVHQISLASPWLLRR
jgi:hypothetical protein